MRKMLILTLGAGLAFGAASALAQKWDDDLQHVGQGMCGGSMGNKPFFSAYLEVGALRASPDFDLANPKLPKPLKAIADIAFAKLESILGTREGWRLHAIRVWPAARELGAKPGFEKKAFYIVEFGDGMYGSASFPVTSDGRLGIVVTKKDEAQAPRLPFD